MLFLKWIKQCSTLLFDVFAIIVAWYLAYWLRYNLQPFPSSLATRSCFLALAVLLSVQIGSYFFFKVYRGLWRFFSINDVSRIIKAVSAATLLTIPLLYLMALLPAIPRSVFPLYTMILIVLLCSARLFRRRLFDNRIKCRTESSASQRVFIIGAGQAGESLLRDLKRTKAYYPVGLVDDNPSKQGMEIHGVQVVGVVHDLARLVKLHRVDLLFIAVPSARSAAMRRIVQYCEPCQIPFRTLPGLVALAAGKVEVNALREVNLDDLLGRDQVHLEWDKIASVITGQRILVTGGGGSIGSELCRQILALRPEKIAIIDHNEFNLYQIEEELKQIAPEVCLCRHLLSVTDQVGITSLFHAFKPHVVFHAAAYKHVPMLEDQVRVAISNNVLGTQIVAQASVQAGVEKFVLISTDKAVNPTNVMGTTKRVAEIFCQNLNERVSTQFITVRFGNVLGSAGSVVPLFQKQLQQGGPLTVTHPDIQRYFMTIPEACQLILQATVNGEGGEIFVLDMGEAIKISYLAQQMIRLSGKEPGRDVAIEYIGLRPGEKLFEELFYATETLTPTTHEKLFKASFRKVEWMAFIDTLYDLKQACQLHTPETLYALLKELVPEFKICLEKHPVLKDAELITV